MTNQRPDWYEYYLRIAEAVAARGTCMRRMFGAVIVNNGQIISTGYNGAPRGTKNCVDLGKCYRRERKIPKGEKYELCRSVHAEMNAIIHASREQMLSGAIYISGIDLEDGNEIIGEKPCKMCRRMIINAGIKQVITRDMEGKPQIHEVSKWIEDANENPFMELDEGGY